jgi:hypothetical protein
MWRRLMRRSFDPRRPPVYMEQWPLALVCAVVIVASVVVVVWALTAA